MSIGGSTKPLYLLVDNGSIRAESALALRRIAGDLAQSTGEDVRPASLAHSTRIDVAELGGEPAPILKETLLDPDFDDHRPVVILPFFVGNRGAIVELVEKTIRESIEERPGLNVSMAPFLFEEDGRGQETLALALAERIREKIDPKSDKEPTVVLVDHGSPRPVAAQVRNFVAGQVQALLKDEVAFVVPSSMERREGKAYAFTDPLLEEVLRRPRLRDNPIILAMFFLLPGRHAGDGGDVAEIREEAEKEFPALEIRTTELLGNHPVVLGALEKIIGEHKSSSNF
ncbi:MAG: CbiX/SirB N-terminal domain-containing protein [Verrucomicrobiota bacterium]